MHAHPWRHVARAAAALAAAMGIGRFAFTPILPLMTAQAHLTPQVAGHLATANYVGYLAGALAGVASSRLARSTTAFRVALLVSVAGLAAMPLITDEIGWVAVRTVAGFVSALIFVFAVNAMLDHLHAQPPHLPGWGLGGVGVGIALSAAVLLFAPVAAGWRGAWWAAAALAAALSAAAWPLTTGTAKSGTAPARPRAGGHRWFSLLMMSYTLEGIGYIIAGTFLVAAVQQGTPGRLGGSAWLVVGLATIPSAAAWAWLSTRRSHPTLLTAALLLQAAGIALAALVNNPVAALVGALLFGATFVGISTLSLAAGRLLRFPRAVALLTAGYSVGQILGPVAVAPLLHRGFQPALITSAVVIGAAALCAAWLRPGFGGPVRIAGRQPAAGVA